MKFEKQDVRLLSIRQFTSKTGKLLTFIKVADKDTYESVELLASRDLDVLNCREGSDYNLVIDFDGRYANANLFEIKG